MDLLSIGLSAILSALLFVVLEFSIILPLFKRIVTKAVTNEVSNNLIPSVNTFVDSKVSTLTDDVTTLLFNKIRGMFGGNKKGVNSILGRLASGEDIEDFATEYTPSTLERALDLFETIKPYLNISKQKPEDMKENPDIEGIREL